MQRVVEVEVVVVVVVTLFFAYFPTFLHGIYDLILKLVGTGGALKTNILLQSWTVGKLCRCMSCSGIVSAECMQRAHVCAFCSHAVLLARAVQDAASWIADAMPKGPLRRRRRFGRVRRI